MYDFAPSADADKATLYADLLSAADALTRDEPDAVANMANLSALIWQFLPDQAACIRIPLGRGVCGTAAQTRETQLVADVHAFPGHIACDAASASEIVVPVVHDGRLIGVLDLDSPCPARFDSADQQGLEALVARVAGRIG